MKSIYNKKKVFITGHTGFKGSWLTEILLIYGAEVKGYSLEATNPGLFHLLNQNERIEHTIADIRDNDKLKKEILAFQPDFIFHLAAQPLVLESYENPVYTYEVNLLGTIYLLDSIRFLEKPCTTIIVTTDKVYEDRNWQYPYRENDILGGYDPYSSSKATCELAVESYRNSFFNLKKINTHNQFIATVRAGNVIGGGDFSKNRLLPDIFKALCNNEKVSLRNPQAVRPWQHVLDALYGYLFLASKIVKSEYEPQYSGAWNFGPEAKDIFTVEEMVKLYLTIYQEGEYVINDFEPQNKETSLLKLDISKSRSLLGWSPKWNANTAISKTVEWQQVYWKEQNKIKQVTQDQIYEFLAL